MTNQDQKPNPCYFHDARLNENNFLETIFQPVVYCLKGKTNNYPLCTPDAGIKLFYEEKLVLIFLPSFFFSHAFCFGFGPHSHSQNWTIIVTRFILIFLQTWNLSDNITAVPLNPWKSQQANLPNTTRITIEASFISRNLTFVEP